MGNRFLAFGLTLIICLLAAASASAGVAHVVQPGESLWSIAASNNFTTRALAAANGLNENSQVVLGSTITIPSIDEAQAALQRMGYVNNQGTSSSTPAPAPAAPASSSPGGYLVKP